MKIEELKNYLLERNPEFSTGVVWDKNSDRDFMGIADNVGNFFYIESEKSFSYSFEGTLSAKGGYLRSENVKLIVGIPDCDIRKAHDIILSQLIYQGAEIRQSDFDTERIYESETGEKIKRNDLKLIRFNITIKSLSFPDMRNCKALCFKDCC